MAADKFTRIGTTEGDILYATTASSIKSIESFEDNVDAKLMTFFGQDNTETSTTSTSETEIAEVIVTANSANNYYIVLAQLEAQSIGQGDGTSRDCTFRLRTGTNSSGPSNTLRETQIVSGGGTDGSNSAVFHNIGGCLMAVIASTDETFSSQFYVHVTAQLETAVGGASGTAVCRRLAVFAI